MRCPWGPFHVLGGVEETCRLLLGGYALRQGERPEGVPALARFASWPEMVEQAETCADRELLLVKRLVEEYGARLPAAVDAVRAGQVADERAAALVLSTTHKAKGREWPWVELAEDFSDPTEPGFTELPVEDQEAEINLLYVAATRARERLTPNPGATALPRQDRLSVLSIGRSPVCQRSLASGKRHRTERHDQLGQLTIPEMPPYLTLR